MTNVYELLLRHRLSATLIRAVPPVVLGGLGLAVVLGGLAALNPSLAILGSIAVLLVALVQTRPVIIVYALTMLLPLTGGMARGGVIPFLRVGQALLVFGFILFLLTRPGRLSKSRLTLIDLAFALFFMTEAIFPILALYYRGGSVNLTSVGSNGVSALQGILGPIQYYLLYRIVVAVICSERQVKMVLNMMFVTSFLVSAIGILEELGVGPVKTFLEINYPIQGGGSSYYTVTNFRIASTLQHYSGLGAYLSFTLILLLACYLTQEQLKISPLLLIITALFDSVTLILTGTFAAWIGLAVGVVIVFIVGRRLPRSVIYIMFGIAVAVLIFQPFIADRLNYQFGQGATQGLVPESFAYRVTLWQQLTLPAIGQHLIFGSGPTPQALADAGQAIEESQYFLLLLQGGLCYLLGYLVLIGAAVITCWRHIRSQSQNASQTVAIGLLAILVAINVMNISGEYFTYVGGTQTLWTLLAITVASRQLRTEELVAAAEQSEGNIARVGGKTVDRSLSKMISTTLDPSPESM